jgi:hypothetical protein
VWLKTEQDVYAFFRKMERGHRNDSKYRLISDSCYLFILPGELKSAALSTAALVFSRFA